MLTGCATLSGRDDLPPQADIGQYPNDYEQIIKNYEQSELKDPDSARYKFLNSPKIGWTQAGLVNEKYYGYVVCVYINARNSFGGYAGNHLYSFVLKNNSVINWQSSSDDDESYMQRICAPFI